MNDTPLSVRLVYDTEKIFEELKELLITKSKISYVLNLLIGLLDKDLPLYYLNDIPEYYKLINNKDLYYEKTLTFLKENFELFLNLLTSEKLTLKEKKNLIYLLGKFAKTASLTPKDILKMGFIVLDLYIEEKIDIAKQLLCRYDFECLLKNTTSQTCKEKMPYKEIINFIKKHNNLDGKLYFAISAYTMDNNIVINKDEILKQAKEILDSIDIKNYYEILPAIEECINIKLQKNLKME
ncbi:hypothetical protein [Caminibacter sp.]